jgi:Inner membrane component of T3SS, cytoplasmic domain
METPSIILKILSGLQAGVEVALQDGDYRIGSGPDDDIHIIDVTLKAGHIRLRISGRKIEIAGGTGVVSAKSGIRRSNRLRY